MTDFAFRRTWGPKPKYERVLKYKRYDMNPIFVAGPCSVENEQQIFSLARLVADMGATHLRGGLFRAGTYPGNNFGLVDIDLVKAYHQAAKDNGLKNIIEILDYRQIELLIEYADCFQVGARSQQNYTLLRELGKTWKTIFLKRNTGCTIDEWLGSAEHLLAAGNCCPVLIERGSSTHMNHVRWDLSISTIPAVKAITDIPIIVDASHGTGRRDLVEPMTLAGIAAGADGCLVEVHNDPENSLSDPDQAITPGAYDELMAKIRAVKVAIGC